MDVDQLRSIVGLDPDLGHPDPNSGLRSFRSAAAAQAAGAGGPDADVRTADALLRLAADGERLALRDVLTPDPAASHLSWTVACYVVGDITPTSLETYTDPAAAVAELAGCDDHAHVAAELVCATDDGMQWVALSRTGRRIGFVLPTPTSYSNDPALDPGRLDAAVARWAERLEAWRPAVGQRRQTVAERRAEEPPAAEAPAAPAASAAVPDPPVLTPPGVARRPPPMPAPAEAATATPQPAAPAGGPSPLSGRVLSSAVRSALADITPQLSSHIAQGVVVNEALAGVVATRVAERLRQRPPFEAAEVAALLAPGLGEQVADTLAEPVTRAVAERVSDALLDHLATELAGRVAERLVDELVARVGDRLEDVLVTAVAERLDAATGPGSGDHRSELLGRVSSVLRRHGDHSTNR